MFQRPRKDIEKSNNDISDAMEFAFIIEIREERHQSL
jgi:hypothetical protein